MSSRVDLSLVRFSVIEDTYFFYDPQHPTAIQFLLNGKWESWDVGWVKHHAHDPDIKHIAADAEAHVVRYTPTYQQWRSTPMPHVAPDGQPFSPSVGSDVSRLRAPSTRPFSPQEMDSPLSPQFSPASTRDVFSPAAIDAPLPPPSQSGSALSPALSPPSAYLARPPLPRTSLSTSRDGGLDRPLIDSAFATHDGTTLAAKSSSTLKMPLPGLPPGSSPIAHLPLIPSITPPSDAPIAASRLPPLSVPPNTVTAAPTPAPQPVTHTSQRHNERTGSLHAADRSPQSKYTDANNDPQPSAIEAPIDMGPHLAPRSPPGVFLPQDNNGETYQESVSPPSVQPPQPLHLLPRKSRDFKVILSLDGDGIRGLSQVFLVEALVGAICTKVNQNINPYQIFDLIGGSSMGAVLGLMLSRLRMQAHTAREAYKFVAKEVFQNKKIFFSSLDPHTVSAPYDAQDVEDAIKTVVAAELPHVDERLCDAREDSADAFIITTQVKIGSNKPAVLRSYQTRRIAGPEIDSDILVWQAMKAAVMAPRYACPQNGISGRSAIEPGLVDYGTTKDNPIIDAYYECRKLYKYSNDKMVIVSIGTGSGSISDRENPEMAKSVLKRNADAEQQCFEFRKDHEDLIESGWLKYFRFNVPNLNDIPLEEWCNEDLIRDQTTAYLGGPDTGRSFHKCVDDITAILTGVQRQP